MASKSKSVGCPRSNTAVIAQPKLPSPPEHILSLRKSDPKRFVVELVAYFQKKKHHPEVCVGWWCCFPKYMSYLITYLSEPFDDDRETWQRFRDQVAIQIKNCRQCATKYHLAVAAWEISGEMTSWSKTVAKKRLQSLLDWDCDRVLPSIIKGADVNEDDPAQLGVIIQCREAFLEALSSLRLCTFSKFCKPLGDVFRKRTPARNTQDVLPFIRSLGSVPSGLLALCFHEAPAVQVWALRVYKDCTKLPTGLQSLLYLLRKAVRHITTLQEALDVDTYINDNDFLSDVHKLQSRWEGFSAVLCTADKVALNAFIEDNEKTCILKYVALALSSKFEKVVKSAYRILRVLLRSLPYNVLFVSGSFSPRELLDHILLGVRRPSNSSATRESLLGLLSPIFTIVRSNCDRKKIIRLHTKCLEKLYDISGIDRLSGCNPHSKAAEALTNLEEHVRDRGTLLKVTSKFLLYFYRYSVPMLPIEDTVMISNIVLSALREDPKSDWGWDLFRFVLLNDVLNILRSIRPSKDVDLIFSTFLGKGIRIGECVEEETYLSDLVNIGENSKPVWTWVGPLWRQVVSGTHIRGQNPENDSFVEKEMSVLFDLHRLIGALDNRLVGALFQEEYLPHLNVSSSPPSIEKQKRRITGCISTVQSIVRSRFLFLCERNLGSGWLRLLPFHVTHLLSSSQKDISLRCMAAMRKSFGLNSTFAVSNPSKLLASALKKNAETTNMLVDGVQSSLCIMFGLKNMVSPRTYASFFLWYRILQNTGYTSQLHEKSVSEWAFAAICSFSQSWKIFEDHVSESEFREACCQFFAQLREVWGILYEDARRKNVHSEPAALRKATSGLFGMHTMKDSSALASWAHTMSSIAPTWRLSEDHRSSMFKIIRMHANSETGCNRLTLEQCQVLVEKGNLTGAKSFLLSWDKNKNKEVCKNTNLKTLNTTRIDDFFSRKASGERSGDGSIRNQGNSSKLGPRGPLGSTRGRLPLFRTTVRPQRGVCHLSELRKELLGDAPVRPKMRRGLQPESQPTKTLFELQREQAIAQKAARLAADSTRAVQPMEVAINLNSTRPSREACEKSVEIAELGAAPIVDLEKEQLHECTLSPDIRKLQPRDMDLLYRALIRNAEPSIPRPSNMKTSGKTFSNAEEYVEFWEPLLTSECRASILNMMKEENSFANNFLQDPQGYRYCRTAFEVQEPPSSIGYFHNLRLRFCADQGGPPREHGQDLSSSQFSIFQAQATDIVYLRIPPARCTERDGGPLTEAVALVSTSKVEKGIHELVLQLCFDHGLDNAPGKGRRIQVSRLMNLITFQRQIEALWSIPNLPDGLLWPILDPAFGLSINSKVDSRQREKSMSLAAGPLDFISDLGKAGSANDSQVNAMRSILRSSGPLLQYHGVTSEKQFFKKNHGALSLVQGPPGTGKTSTIMNLISAFITTSFERFFPRIVRVSVDDIGMRIRIPAIRVLVCAPSNAAVDEIMSRVIEHGLTLPDGGKACPRIVRVGHGTTLDKLKRFELRTLAKYGEKEDRAESDLEDTKTRLEHRCRALQVVNERISEVHNKRLELMEKEKEEKIDSSKYSSSGIECQIQSLTDQLTLLHDEKDSLKSHLSQVRDERKVQDQAKKVDRMKRMSRILNQSSLVFSTLNSAGHELVKTLGVNFDVVIIDEAAQSIEPESLIPISLGAKGRSSPKFSHVVFVGDPQQLPATVVSTNPTVSKQLRTSLFERICSADRERVMVLNVQYRMHPSISSFPNAHFYFGKIRDGPNVLEKQITKAFHHDAKKRFGPLSFFDTSGMNHIEKRTAKGSVSNLAEARLVIRILENFIGSYRDENFKDSIVLLSPYRQQVVLLEQLVRECVILKSMNIEVSTIDGIQGREKPVVVLSTVRGGNCKDIGFVNDERRMNVALTRAKYSLLIVGNAMILGRTSVPWQGLIRHCRENSHVISLSKNCNTVLPGENAEGNGTGYRNRPPLSLGCVSGSGDRFKKRDTTDREYRAHPGRDVPQENDHQDSAGKLRGKVHEPQSESLKRPTPEKPENIARDVKKRRGGKVKRMDLTANGDSKTSARTGSGECVVAPPIPKSLVKGVTERKLPVEKHGFQTEDRKLEQDRKDLGRLKDLQTENGDRPIDRVLSGQQDAAKTRTRDSVTSGNTALRSLPLRSNVPISLCSDTAKKVENSLVDKPSSTARSNHYPIQKVSNASSSNVTKACNPHFEVSNAAAPKHGPTQKVSNALDRPFAPWKSKANSTPKDGSLFETNPAARFVPPEVSKKGSFLLEKDPRARFVQPEEPENLNSTRRGRNTLNSRTETQTRSKSMAGYPTQRTVVERRADVVKPHSNLVSQLTASDWTPSRSHSKPNILSRLGTKQRTSDHGIQKHPQPNPSWESTSVGNPFNGTRTSPIWNQNLVGNGHSPQSQPPEMMKRDGTREILPIPKSFPGHSTGIHKVNQKRQRKNYVRGIGDGAIDASQHKNPSNLRLMPRPNVNHRGFVKRTNHDEQRMRGNASGKDKNAVSNRKLQPSGRNRHSNAGYGKSKRFPSRSGPLGQPRSMFPSTNGSHQDLTFQANQTNNFGQRTQVNHQRLTSLGNQSNSKNKVTAKVHKSTGGGSLLQRLQAAQEQTFSIVKPSDSRR
ncbi:unnamed protein product [Agarophyton chilense]